MKDNYELELDEAQRIVPALIERMDHLPHKATRLAKFGLFTRLEMALDGFDPGDYRNEWPRSVFGALAKSTRGARKIAVNRHDFYVTFWDIGGMTIAVPNYPIARAKRG